MLLLPPRTTCLPHTPEALLGRTVTARPPTLRRVITGVVLEVDGRSVVIDAGGGLLVAVHVEDCEITEQTEQTDLDELTERDGPNRRAG